MQVAIDGFAASGKSTAARLLAKELGYLYLDTGAMYRAVTLECIRQKTNFDNNSGIIEAAKSSDIEPRQDWTLDRGYRIFINGKDETENLFTPEVDNYVSQVARTGEVRKILVKKQRSLAEGNDIVMAGRDIGTNVLPHADVKIFLTASPKVRAERRLKELEEKGETGDYEKVLANISLRDHIDSTRKDNPLVKADDAVEVDCSHLTIEEMVEKIKHIVKKKQSEK